MASSGKRLVCEYDTNPVEREILTLRLLARALDQGALSRQGLAHLGQNLIHLGANSDRGASHVQLDGFQLRS